jgi:hypothetical protein
MDMQNRALRLCSINMEKGMPLTKARARTLAWAWAGKQDRLPLGRIVLCKGYNARRGARLCEVQYTPEGENGPFILISFFVYDDERVEVLKDRRDYVESILAHKGVRFDEVPAVRGYSHEEALQRFLEAVTKTGNPPSWLLGIEPLFERPNSQTMEDAVARIRIMKKKKMRETEVAVKVKTSAKARSEFYRTLPVNLPRKVLAFLIKPEMSDEEIRSTFFRTVEGVCNVVKD